MKSWFLQYIYTVITGKQVSNQASNHSFTLLQQATEDSEQVDDAARPETAARRAEETSRIVARLWELCRRNCDCDADSGCDPKTWTCPRSDECRACSAFLDFQRIEGAAQPSIQAKNARLARLLGVSKSVAAVYLAATYGLPAGKAKSCQHSTPSVFIAPSFPFFFHFILFFLH